MTRRVLRRWVVATIVYFAAVVALGLCSAFWDDRTLYHAIKDLLAAIVAIPATWLAACLQERISFVEQLRTLWSKTVHAVQSAMHYTYNASPTHPELTAVLLELGVVIEEYRAVFRNLNDDSDGKGKYPFESLKTISRIMRDLGYGEKAGNSDREAIRKSILDHWRQVREPLMMEFDRETPTYYDVEQKESRA